MQKLSFLKRQIRYQLSTMESITVSVILLWIVMINYLKNVFTYQGTDCIAMYHSMKLLSISFNQVNVNANLTLVFTMIFPFLAVMSAGFSYDKERTSGQEVHIKYRIGNQNYLCVKTIVAFLSSFLIFFLPFLLEIVANLLSFPKAIGDLSNAATIDPYFIELEHNYFGYSIYKKNAVLYAVLGCVQLAAFAGTLSAFTVVISYFWKVKFRVLLFVPVFVYLEFSILMDKLKIGKIGLKAWHEYILLFTEGRKSVIAWIVFWLIMIITIVIAVIKSRRMESCN